MTTETEIESPHAMYGLIHKALGSLIEDCQTKDHFFNMALDLVENELDDESTKGCFTYVLNKFNPLSLEEIRHECDTIPAFIADKYPETANALLGLEIELITAA